MIVFFFEEEEGIRDSSVTGVQTCALPISKGAYNRPSYPCHYCTYRGGLLRQGAVDKAKADDQRHAGERQHHHLQVRKAVGGKQQIVHTRSPKTSLSLVGASRRKVQPLAPIAQMDLTPIVN